jgi:hypothetical protein
MFGGRAAILLLLLLLPFHCQKTSFKIGLKKSYNSSLLFPAVTPADLYL